MKSRRIKREWLIVFAFIGGMMFTTLIDTAYNRLQEIYNKCDSQKGYTCNVFAR